MAALSLINMSCKVVNKLKPSINCYSRFDINLRIYVRLGNIKNVILTYHNSQSRVPVHLHPDKRKSETIIIYEMLEVGLKKANKHKCGILIYKCILRATFNLIKYPSLIYILYE